MRDIKKVSDISANDIAEYLRIPEVEEIQSLVNFQRVAENYIADYTGLTIEQLDEHPDLVIVVFILCEDMYDNRCNYVQSDKLNKTVETILGMHQVNLL